MQVPCKDCPHRELGCHGRCESYAKYNRQREEARARAALRHEQDYYDRKRFDDLRRRRHEQ